MLNPWLALEAELVVTAAEDTVWAGRVGVFDAARTLAVDGTETVGDRISDGKLEELDAWVVDELVDLASARIEVSTPVEVAEAFFSDVNELCF